MKPQCRQQLNALRESQGRGPLTDAQAAQIEARIKGAAAMLRNRDLGAWQKLTADQRTAMAAEQAMKDIAHEAARVVRNVQLQAIKTADIETRAQRATDPARKGALSRSEFWADEIHKVSDEARVISKEYVSQMMGAMEAATSMKDTGAGRKALMFLFDAENPRMTMDIALELHARGKAGTGNQMAIKAAAEYEKVNEALRVRFNAAGGDVGKLDYGYMPNAWDGDRVLSAGYDKFAESNLPRLDRARYTNEDGSRMSDADLLAFLTKAAETIATNGADAHAPGAFKGAGATANRGAAHRQIHWKDGAAYLEAMREFGGGGMHDALVRHIEMMTRDIAMMERFGPNPQAQHRLQSDLAARANGSKKPALVAWSSLDHHWSTVAGVNAAQWEFTPPVIGEAIERVTLGKVSGRFTGAGAARFWQHARNVEVFSKLGSAFFSALSDTPTYYMTTGFNKLSYLDALQNHVRSLNPLANKEMIEFMNQQGLIADTLIDSMNRMSVDQVTANWSGKLSQATMRLSLLDQWTNAGRRAFALSMQQGVARWVKTPWAELDEWTREVVLSSRGITEADWAVMQAAQLTPTKWGDILTPQAIYAIPDADVLALASAGADRIRAEVQKQTADLMARNAQDAQWISGRIDKFDEARDAMNRWVKARQAKRLDKNQEATGPMLERMALLDAQREQAQLHADMEADFNRFSTQDEVRAFINAVEDGASADKTDRSAARPAVRAGLESAETIGRRYGEQKGRLERRMVEIENRIAEMDRAATRAADADAKAAQKKADAMAADLREFIKKSQDRQARRAAVVQRIQDQEAPRIAEEAQRVRSEAVKRYMALLQHESTMAITDPDVAARAFIRRGTAPGSITGEAARLIGQFQTFPLSMFTRHWRRILDTPRGLEGAPLGFREEGQFNKLAALGGMIAMMGVAGAIVLQIKQIRDGKDPLNMNPAEDHGVKFWTQALLQGGGFGFIGGLLLNPPEERGSRGWEGTIGALGPVAGTIGAAIDLTHGNLMEAAQGKDTHFWAEGIRFAKNHAPLVGLWYTRSAIDHAVLQSLQEWANPGYLQRIKARARKDWGATWYWEPGQPLPERAPNLSFEQLAGRN